MKRHKHSLSHYKLATLEMGKLIPISAFEVLPGDTIQQATSALVRMSPLLAPVMHPVQVRIHHWYVPYRVLWPQWEDFITGGPDGKDATSLPIVNINIARGKGSLADYFGMVAPPSGSYNVIAFPFYAYNLIWNEFYRDQDLETERPLTSPSPANVAWEKDYFTSARPWTQKGDDVTIPLGGTAPVLGIGVDFLDPQFSKSNVSARQSDGATSVYANAMENRSGGTSENPSEKILIERMAAGSYPNIRVDLSQADAAASVNDFRKAFALQRYQEARARYGSRYTEYLRYLGVRSSDARLQRPEYLGGGKQTISFSEVLQTGPDASDEGVAQMKGHGIAAMRSRRYRRFFEEHGVVLSLVSVRPKTIYTQALHRQWMRRTKEDFWQKELEHIGQQEVWSGEVYPQDSAAEANYQTFGYQDRYAEYRNIPSTVAGDFRDTLNHWHLARSFAGLPALNGNFVQADPSKRIFAEQSEDALWCMFNHSIQARRMVSRSASSRIF